MDCRVAGYGLVELAEYGLAELAGYELAEYGLAELAIYGLAELAEYSMEWQVDRVRTNRKTDILTRGAFMVHNRSDHGHANGTQNIQI